jgi:hypothetical protein
LAAGLALPVAGLASTSASPTPAPVPQQAAGPSGKLVYRTLGKTGMKVTTVGYGCMITSDPSVISRAVDMGINYFDTSRGYQNGQNERMVGAALGAKRKDVFVSTKADGPWTGASILAQLDTSLKELNTDHVDVWLLHGLGSGAQITDELVEAQRKAKQAGKVRFIGMSTHNLPAVADRVVETKLEIVQAQYNFTSAAEWGPALDKLNQAGVGVVAMKVMAARGGGGRRGGAQAPAAPPTPVGRMTAALKWAIKNPVIATTVPSMTDIDQLEQNFAVMGQSFSDADQKVLTATLREIRPYFCSMCGTCEGQCSKGLQARDLVRFVMYADGYGQFPLGRENFQKMSAEHQAIRCADCSSCTVKCPYGVRVAEMGMRAQELFA